MTKIMLSLESVEASHRYKRMLAIKRSKHFKLRDKKRPDDSALF